MLLIRVSLGSLILLCEDDREPILGKLFPAPGAAKCESQSDQLR